MSTNILGIKNRKNISSQGTQNLGNRDYHKTVKNPSPDFKKDFTATPYRRPKSEALDRKPNCRSSMCQAQCNTAPELDL